MRSAKKSLPLMIHMEKIFRINDGWIDGGDADGLAGADQ